MTLGAISAVTGGTVDAADRDVVVSAAASVDSRAVEVGGLFVAVSGERMDGHEFAAAAVAGGAAAVLSARPVGVPCVVGTDPLEALGLLAAHVRSRLERCSVVAVTGSQGKTSAKDILAQLLATVGETVATRGNLNNEIGVPLTLLRATADTRNLVVEMGARSVGNIAHLCGLARPDVGVVLNVGTAHIGEFGSRELIAVAKGELVEALPPHGTAVLNADDPLVSAMASRTSAAVRTFGAADDADVVVRDLRLDAAGEPHFTLAHRGDEAAVHLPLLGAHHASNAAAAAVVALTAGMNLAAVATVLGSVAALSRWRMERTTRTDGTVVVNDAYNANPDSMAAALRTVAVVARGTRRRSVAVLGEMRELGPGAEVAHEAVGALAAELGIDRLVVVGAEAAAIERGARRGGAEVVAVADPAGATAWLDRHLVAGDVVLVKASRAAGLERVADHLLGARGDTAQGDTARDGTARDARTGHEGNDAR